MTAWPDFPLSMYVKKLESLGFYVDTRQGASPKLNLVWMFVVRGANTSMQPLWHPARMQSSGVAASAVMGP